MRERAKSAVPFLTEPLPARRAAAELGRRLASYITKHRPQQGTRLATEAELVKLSKLSRSTIRRALEPLHEAGWIERRAGVGTMVGPRVTQLDGPLPLMSARLPRDNRRGTARDVTRVAVLIFNIGDLAHDWYTPAVLRGMDDASDECQITVELLGDNDRDMNAISRRLERSRPDVLVCLSNQPRDAFVIRDAQRLGINCIISGTPHMGLGLPTILEDNRQALRLAFDHLYAQGHRRIGLGIQTAVEPWVMQRFETYLACCAGKGNACPPATLWLTNNARQFVDDEALAATTQFLAASKVTAMICASRMPHRAIVRLSNSGRLSIPDDLSVITFEQSSSDHKVGEIKLTNVVFPFEEMGRRVARLARRVATSDDLPTSDDVLPSRLKDGESVRKL